MTIRNHDQVLRLASAEQAATKNFSTEDLNSPVAACPARQTEIFIVPVRYALSEQAAEHPSFQPSVTPSSHPMALRCLRKGYLYIWHQSSQLKRYAIADDGLLIEQGLDAPDTSEPSGNQTGVALNKQHDAWLMFSEIPLPASVHQLLAESASERQKRMRQVSLTQIAYNLTATHCPPLELSDQLMAELMPESREQALARDHEKNGDARRADVKALGQHLRENPAPELVQAYVNASLRLREGEQAVARHPKSAGRAGEWSAVAWEVSAVDTWLSRARSEAGALHAVFASLDDDLGVLRDINHEQERVETLHENWVADNNLRQSVGGFIRSMIREDGGEVSNLLNYRYRDHDIQLTPVQGETILESQRRLEELFKKEAHINQERGRQYSHTQAEAELARVHAEAAATTAPVREFLPPELYNQAELIVREYRKEKVTNLAGGRTAAQVAEHIDLERMDAWLDEEAPQHYRQVEECHKALYADRTRFLPRISSGTWFVDYSNGDHLRWLDAIAKATLSAQCCRQEGADQFAGYVRSDDAGSLRLVFHAWSPSLEAAVNSTNRLNEILAALSRDNLTSTQEALASLLDEPALAAVQRVAQDMGGAWVNTVSRLGAALLALKAPGGVASQWAGAFVAARLGNDARLVRFAEGTQRSWRLVGGKADTLNQWLRGTVQAIGQGRASAIAQSSAVQNSGGLLPLAALLLNGLNANHYLSQASAVEEMDSRRLAETVSATLYAGAALTAVIQNWLIIGKGIDEVGRKAIIAPTLTLFGGIVGVLSFGAASREFQALQQQIEQAQTRVDLWLERRQAVTLGQSAIYFTQAALGFSLTGMRMANRISTAQAIRYFRLGMAPINLLLLGLGGAYLYAWSKQSTPMQNYLVGCCWSKTRAFKREDIPPEAQLEEFQQLLALIFQPRVHMETKRVSLISSNKFIRRLIIDLPGAEPRNTRLGLALLGNPTNWDVLLESKNPFGHKPLSDLGAPWLRRSRCEWIPSSEGQGLRLSGDFELGKPFMDAPSRLLLRLRYSHPLAMLSNVGGVVGDEQGLSYSLDADNGLILLRDGESTSELGHANLYSLGEGPNAVFLQPRGGQ